jgi:germination protein YpeB
VYSTVKGEELYAQVSKIGGKIIMFSYAGSCLSSDITKDYAIEKATAFLQSQNLFNMTPVWINLSNNVYTINFAFEESGIIVYSDLVKVRVCAQTAMVIGLEATEYYTNHTERTIPSVSLTKEEAMEKVSSNIEISTSRLALVPVGNTLEVLCYEFSGEYDGSTFYAYIDAKTGRQVELFKVIKAGEGELLM